MAQGTEPRRDPRKIFIVHGRDIATRDQLIKFLKHIDTWPISWTEARKATGKPSPTTLEIVATGLKMAQAVVVLFTPDDRAQLLPRFLQPHDGIDERELTGQARQNVLLEAGMALGMAPERTVLVRYERPRRISDIEGVNWITLSDSYEDRRALVDAMTNAGVLVDERRNLVDYSEAGKYYDDSVRWGIRWNEEGIGSLINLGPGAALNVKIQWEAHGGSSHSLSYEEIQALHSIKVTKCSHGVLDPSDVGDIEIWWNNPDRVQGTTVVKLSDWPRPNLP
jgi:predicted nucleotide-binding protein